MQALLVACLLMTLGESSTYTRFLLQKQAAKPVKGTNAGKEGSDLVPVQERQDENDLPAQVSVDVDRLNFALQLESLMAEYYSCAAFGTGLPGDTPS